MRSRIRQYRSALRVICVALLLLCVAITPALVLASEIHESDHVIQAGHSHDAGSGVPAEEPGSPDSPSEWHLLLHSGHCCGHGTLLIPTLFAFASPAPAMPPATADQPPFESCEHVRLLRPPIIG